MAKVTAKGKFTPKNRSKYVGHIVPMIYRSSWEHEFMKFLDGNPNILEWACENIAIPYVKPTDGRIHKYYPDFYVKYNDKQGVLHKEIVEVKPYNQTVQPTTQGKNKRIQLYEAVTYAINLAKWKACVQYCNKYGLKFRIITERRQFA